MSNTKTEQMQLTQLPDDVYSTGYRQTGEYRWEQTFRSPSLNFEGTESDFYNAGHAYRYSQIDNFTRRVA